MINNIIGIVNKYIHSKKEIIWAQIKLLLKVGSHIVVSYILLEFRSGLEF